MLCVRPVENKGLGVFALRHFNKYEVIERTPVILLSDPQWELINQTALEHYYYTWGQEAACLTLGFGSLYNHSDNPNAEARRRTEDRVMEFVALRDIEAETEITIKYGCPLWFKSIG